jgi:uncharacterized protein (DUF983 family)
MTSKHLGIEPVESKVAELSDSNSLGQVRIRRGSLCPNCGEGKMDFNGLLDLECSHCGFSRIEGAGCS